MLKRFGYKIFSGAASAVAAVSAAAFMLFHAALPRYINADCAVWSEEAGFAPAVLRCTERDTEYCLGNIPIKRAVVNEQERRYVIPSGEPFGITLLYDGVMVTDTVEDSPARRAGIKAGDIIISANGRDILTNEALGEAVTCSDGRVDIIFRRGEREIMTEVTPEPSGGELKIGAYVRDSAAGIGTLTFIDPETGMFGGLGHAVSDASTGDPAPLLSGEAVTAEIYDVIKGERGSAGELCGTIRSDSSLGEITENLTSGVFGKYGGEIIGEAVPAAFRQEVKTGEATVLTTVDGESPREYSIEIERINLPELTGTRAMVIRITDPELLEKTGGIVRGMSGSPILQNGRLAGAVTHVLLNDPTRGYAVFAETMLGG